jgi:hypothetical protein
MFFERELHARFNKRPPKILLWGHKVELFNAELRVHKVVIRLLGVNIVLPFCYQGSLTKSR